MHSPDRTYYVGVYEDGERLRALPHDPVDGLNPLDAQMHLRWRLDSWRALADDLNVPKMAPDVAAAWAAWTEQGRVVMSAEVFAQRGLDSGDAEAIAQARHWARHLSYLTWAALVAAHAGSVA